MQPLPRRRLNLLATILSAVLLVALAAAYTAEPVCTIGAGDDLGCARGFQTREGDQRPFRWTDQHAWVTLPGLGWGGPRILSITLAAPRPAGTRQPIVRLYTPGLTTSFTAPAEWRRTVLLAPAGLPGSDTLTLTIDSDTFEPARDQRDLGVAVAEVRTLPSTTAHLPGLGPILTLSLIVAATWRICARLLLETLRRRSARQLGSLGLPILTLLGLVVLWVLLPMRVAPFLTGLAITLALGAWGIPRAAANTQLPSRIWLMALAGATIDAALIYGAIPSGLVVLAVTAQAMFVVLAAWSAYQRPLALSSLLTLTLLVRMLSLAARILTGNAAVDPDTELFYNYGRATIEVGVPIVEYPSGALLIWALMALPASRELFALVLPCLNLACDLAIVWGIATIGQNTQRTQPTSLPALAYAFTPLLLPFWHGKYDPLPAALTIVGLALFVRRPFWSGSALGLGGTIKWVPWLAMPILLWEPCRQLLRQAHAPQRLGRFVLGLTCAILLASLPFALRDWQAFLSPYTAQGARPLIGESIWFLPALAFEPTLLAKLASPWSGTESRLITPAITLLVQTMALLLLGLAALLLAPQQQRTLALAALAPAVFLLLNRVYSPQYALPISACLLAAGAAVLHERRSQLLLIGAITLMQAANLMVWPFTRSYWLIPSALQFAAGLGATIALAICACRTKTSSSSPQLRSQGLV